MSFEFLKENVLLARLSPEIFNRIAPHFTVFTSENGRILLNGGDQIDVVYFPLSQTLSSIIALSQEGACVEIGMIAAEGVVGGSVFFGEKRTPHQILIQVPGRLAKIRADLIVQEFNGEKEVRDSFLTFFHEFFTTVSQTALCNRIHTVQQRMARWLMMTYDRVQSARLPLTQEFLAKMLGANRTTVSEAAIVLQEKGVISYRRGEILVEDVSALTDLTCECYSSLKEYFRTANKVD